MIIKLRRAEPLNNEIFDQFNKALKERIKRGHEAEITFIDKFAKIKEHKNWERT